MFSKEELCTECVQLQYDTNRHFFNLLSVEIQVWNSLSISLAVN